MLGSPQRRTSLSQGEVHRAQGDWFMKCVTHLASIPRSWEHKLDIYCHVLILK